MPGSANVHAAITIHHHPLTVKIAYLRKLFVHGARAVITRIKRDEHSFGEWLNRIEARSPKNVAIVAMANNLARIAWAVLTSGEVYSATAATGNKHSHQVCKQIG